jgi:hypothetical protein
MESAATPRTSNALRQKRYRERRRDDMPTEAKFDREVSRIVFANVSNVALRPTDAISQARSRLLQRYAFEGINRHRSARDT